MPEEDPEEEEENEEGNSDFPNKEVKKTNSCCGGNGCSPIAFDIE